MEDLKKEEIRGVYIAPKLDFSVQTGICTIEGESFLEETAEFYSPVLNWLKQFIETQKKDITFNIKLIYFNTSTSKWLLNMLYVLKKYEDNGGKVSVNWYYNPDDVDMLEEIDDYIMDSGLPINKIPF